MAGVEPGRRDRIPVRSGRGRDAGLGRRPGSRVFAAGASAARGARTSTVGDHRPEPGLRRCRKVPQDRRRTVLDPRPGHALEPPRSQGDHGTGEQRCRMGCDLHRLRDGSSGGDRSARREPGARLPGAAGPPHRRPGRGHRGRGRSGGGPSGSAPLVHPLGHRRGALRGAAVRELPLPLRPPGDRGGAAPDLPTPAAPGDVHADRQGGGRELGKGVPRRARGEGAGARPGGAC